MFARQQRLVVVRPMKVDEPITDLLQDSHSCLRSIDELAIGSRARINPFEKELTTLAWVDSLVFENPIDTGALTEFEGSLNRALIGASPDQRFVRTLAEHQLQRAENYRFPSARFPCHDCEAGRKIPVQRLDKSKVPDS